MCEQWGIENHNNTSAAQMLVLPQQMNQKLLMTTSQIKQIFRQDEQFLGNADSQAELNWNVTLFERVT